MVIRNKVTVALQGYHYHTNCLFNVNIGIVTLRIKYHTLIDSNISSHFLKTFYLIFKKYILNVKFLTKKLRTKSNKVKYLPGKIMW